MRPKAVVLVSGGLDSATVLAVAARDGYETYALTVDYGQRHARELASARLLAGRMGVAAHSVIAVDLRAFGGSALTDSIAVPKNRRGPAAAIPPTYVPARNTIMLSLALAWAEVLGARDIFIGVNAVDYSGYPDCRPEFIRAFEQLASVATKAGVEGDSFRIHAPLLDMSKREIVELGTTLNVDFGLTLSCYDPSPDGAACGECDACTLRLGGFAEAGIEDPVRYAAR